MNYDPIVSLFVTRTLQVGCEPFMDGEGEWHSPGHRGSTQEWQLETLNDFWLDLQGAEWPVIPEAQLTGSVLAMDAGLGWAARHRGHPALGSLVHRHMLYLMLGRAVVGVDLDRGRLRLPGVSGELSITAMAGTIPADAWAPGQRWVGGVLSLSYCGAGMMEGGDLEVRLLPLPQATLAERLPWGSHYV
ncbi:hypothetical protein E7T06_05200 [Deinococcus sp. Arct2-2]|uniref:hypothetical protein n=1 Tax=Deinococcus sp. Arct2-2 TaxID=2568653 RepID=UPI0010A44EDC|nr:hypothetical protein [Deinococcus sp. Arct2-2]THF70953.1 hypothetical protein E7T06_05200 [Deinococcus sp. Arct2-2]